MNAPARYLAVGDTLLLSERDYLYGEGRLLLRIAGVDAITPDGWVDVHGQELGPDGAVVRARGWVRIRLAAVSAALAAAGAWLRSAA